MEKKLQTLIEDLKNVRSSQQCFNFTILALLLVMVVQLLIINRRLVVVEEEEQMEVKRDSTINLYSLELTPETFDYVCAIYQIEHPEIVYAQAKLESGGFTSNVYKTKNNFLGLYDSKNQTYYSYKHWSDCLLKYKEKVQSKWDGNCDYYKFLIELPYATDSNYIYKVQSLVND